ncbi:hypothetical protein [Nocardia sp. NPDC057668]|uniref:hypothetical protein n=1 Tax=Nocardia sp. NPDC057668 TaxID=3346202 RepID=UPI00367078AD
MRNDSDPLQNTTARLADALTAARTRARSADGWLQVEARADGEITIHIDDRAPALTGGELGRRLTALAQQALADARAHAAAALAAFRADPRIEAAVQAATAAIDAPRPELAGVGSRSMSGGEPATARSAHAVSAPAQPAPPARDPRARADAELARELEFEDEVRENQAFLRRSLGR